MALELQLRPSVFCRARQLSRLSDRRHDLVRLERGKDVFDEPERNRQGVAHHVGNPNSSFETVTRQRARIEAHPGALEAAGLTLLFLVAAPGRYLTKIRRIIILLDARAVLGAAQCGRTSARSIRRERRRIAALQFGGNLRIHFLYVPRDTPADAPSRGHLCHERGHAKL